MTNHNARPKVFSPMLILAMAIAWGLAMAVLIGYVLIWAVDLPTVYVHAVTDECLHVESWTPEDQQQGYSCTNLPDRYEQLVVGPEWLKPEGK
jgi:hypothetical protein